MLTRVSLALAMPLAESRLSVLVGAPILSADVVELRAGLQ
jgi:hypothetical protein